MASKISKILKTVNNRIVNMSNNVYKKVDALYNEWLNKDNYILNKPYDEMSLNDCYTYCEVLTRKKGTNFYLGFTMLPKDKRNAIFASYAFCRFVDDIVDENDGDGKDKLETMLLKWENALEECYKGNGGRHPITRALADAVQKYPIPKHAFQRLIDGARLDIIKNRYETFNELLVYCDLVAATISEISLGIFGYQNDKAVEYGKYLAIALQLTNIIRDVGEDAKRGRIYLPLEDLRRFGYSEAELLRGEFNDKFFALIEFQIARAKKYYAMANPLLTVINKDSRIGIYLMGSVYVYLLNKIEKMNLPILKKRVGLSFFEKQILLIKGVVNPNVYLDLNDGD